MALNSPIPPNQSQQKDTLADHLSSLLHIRGYAIAVQQTNLTQITDPPPGWFNTLNTNLATAKKHAEVWTTTLEPAITSTIPQAVIDFANRFNIASKAILDTLTSSNYQPNASQRQTIANDLAWMTRHLDIQLTNITNLQGQYTTFQQNANADLTALTSGVNSIQSAISADQQTITSLNADIATQTANIAADSAAITASGIAGGVGLFVGVGLLGLGAAAGPAAPFLIGIGIFVMIGSIVEMAAVIAVYEQKLAAAQSKLNEDQAQLTLENQQVASLTALSTSINNLVDLNKAMAQSLANIADWWATVKTKLDSVIKDVQDATDDTSKQDWDDLYMDIQAAQTDWTNFQTFATNMQNITTGAAVQQANVQPKAS